MRIPVTLCACALLVPSVAAQAQVLVIESQSPNSGHDMDAEWCALATSVGHTVTMGTQSDLAGNGYFASTDVLIVSSGIIALPPAARSSIADFLAQGGRVYLQGEYSPTYETNVLFAELVNSNGGTFDWTESLSGSLAPVTIAAPLDGPTPVAPLDYFHYGATGTGSGVTAFMIDSGGRAVGWVFEAPGGGRLAHTSDQDWVRAATSEDLDLMTNLLEWLQPGHVGDVYCEPAVINSTGQPARLRVLGDTSAAANNVSLTATSLPPDRIGIFLVSPVAGFFVGPGGSQGNLCIANPIGRYNAVGQVQSSGADGTFELVIDLTMTPTPSGPISIGAGETWYFQCWYRDANPGPTTNFTSAVSLTFL